MSEPILATTDWLAKVVSGMPVTVKAHDLRELITEYRLKASLVTQLQTANKNLVVLGEVPPDGSWVDYKNYEEVTKERDNYRQLVKNWLESSIPLTNPHNGEFAHLFEAGEEMSKVAVPRLASEIRRNELKNAVLEKDLAAARQQLNQVLDALRASADVKMKVQRECEELRSQVRALQAAQQSSSSPS